MCVWVWRYVPSDPNSTHIQTQSRVWKRWLAEASLHKVQFNSKIKVSFSRSVIDFCEFRCLSTANTNRRLCNVSEGEGAVVIWSRCFISFHSNTYGYLACVWTGYVIPSFCWFYFSYHTLQWLRGCWEKNVCTLMSVCVCAVYLFILLQRDENTRWYDMVHRKHWMKFT